MCQNSFLCDVAEMVAEICWTVRADFTGYIDAGSASKLDISAVPHLHSYFSITIDCQRVLPCDDHLEPKFAIN